MSIVVINAVTVTEEGRADFEERFAKRAGKVSQAPGFEAFELLKQAMQLHRASLATTRA